MSEIKIESVEQEDVPAILEFMKEFFYKDEPINHSLSLEYSEELGDFSTMSVSDKCSFKAVNSDGEIVGVLINGISKRPTSSEPPVTLAVTENEKFNIILKWFEYVDSKYSVFDSYPDIDRYLDAKIISVNKNYCGQGIAGKLTDRTIEYCRANNIPVFSMTCSSEYSARVCKKSGFKQVFELNFKDYVVDGKNPILPAEPHKALRVFVQEIQ